MANTKSGVFVDASNQYLSITDADQTGLDLSTTLTFEFWARLNSLVTAQQYFIYKWPGTTAQRSYELDLATNGNLRLQVMDGTNKDTFVVVPSLSADTWHHIAVTWSGASKTAKFYLDGSQTGGDQTDTDVSSIVNGNGDVLIASDGATTNIDGKLDEFIVWNDVRTDGEISDSYNSGDGKIYEGDEAGMVAYWRMEDDFTDTTSNDNDLTNNNSVSFSADVPFAGGGGAFDLVVDTMALTLTFNAVLLEAARKLVADTMALTLTYNAILLEAARKLVADTMALILTFNDVVLTRTFAGVTLVVDTMALTFTYNTVLLKKLSKLVVDTMAMTFTFNAVGLVYTQVKKLVVDTMALVFTFADVMLRTPGKWANKSKNTSTWTNKSKN